MAKTVKTLDLKEILTKHKKRYIEWDQLLKKITKAWKTKLGLTDKSSALDVQNALLEYMGDHLMFADQGEEKILCLAEKMTQEEWASLIFEEKNSVLTTILAQHQAKEKKSYMPLKLKAAELAVFGLKAKPVPGASALEKAISPFLGSELTLLKKKPARGKEILCLAYKISHEELIRESIQTLKKTFSLKTIADDVPLGKDDFLQVFNAMLSAGQVQITKIDDKFAVIGVRLQTSGFRLQEASQIPPEVRSPKPDVDLFRAAFVKQSQGRFYARICNMRRELGWCEERFNALLRKLRADGTIHLHAGDVSTMTEADVTQSYTDENHFFYVNLTWKETS